jgi:hypothetical protein
MNMSDFGGGGSIVGEGGKQLNFNKIMQYDHLHTSLIGMPSHRLLATTLISMCSLVLVLYVTVLILFLMNDDKLVREFCY